MSSRSAYVYALSAVLLWSTVASAFKLSLRYMEPLALLFYSSLVSLSVLFLVLLSQGRLGFLKRLSKSDYLHYALLGLLNPFVYYLVLFKAYDILPAQEAQPLNYTWQIVLSVFSVFVLKQRVKLRSTVAIGIAFFGILVISSRGSMLHFSDPLGVALALGSAFIWASFWILNLKDGRNAVEKLFMCFLFGPVYIGAFFLFMGPSAPPVEGLMGAAYVGLFEMGMAFILWLKALELSEKTAEVSMLIYLSPFISFIIIHIFVGEEILISSVVGTVLIVLGVLLGTWKRWSEEERKGVRGEV